jgi:hypothetical protein
VKQDRPAHSNRWASSTGARVLVIVFVLLALFGIWLYQASVRAVQQPLQSETLLARNMGLWQYSIVRDEAEGSWIVIKYAHDTIADLEAYVDTNKALIPDLERVGGPVEVAVSFRTPLDPGEFRTWAKENDFQARETQLAAGGTTLGIMGRADDPLPSQSLDKYPYAGLHGVFGSYGTVDAKRLSTIAADPQVFLLDMTPTYARRELTRAGFPEAVMPKTDVHIDLAYGWMEILGIIPTPTFVPGPVGTAPVPTLPAPPPDPPTPPVTPTAIP